MNSCYSRVTSERWHNCVTIDHVEPRQSDMFQKNDSSH